ncbi:hypothetical protein HZS_2822 [Henneguya salminicola]|nr:hypothetical protein HZS_2822 [Henneguya salminicola]
MYKNIISSRPGRIVSMESERGFCTVYFEAYDHSETVEISNIRRPPLSTTQNKTSSKARNKAELEKMKRKKHKKVQDKKTRFQEVEKAHEEDKQKWQSFFKSSSSKNKLKGIMKSGIANMPSIETGRVGSGNSDRAGKPVTKYHIRPHNYKK